MREDLPQALGHEAAGDVGELVTANLARQQARRTVANGQIRYAGRHATGTGGTVFTTPADTPTLEHRGAPYRILELSPSLSRKPL